MARPVNVLKKDNIVKYFWSQVNKERGDTGCWIWEGGSRGSNYGGFYDENGNQHYAHKFAFFQARNRRYDARARLLHKCNNTLCVNPRHLKINRRMSKEEGYKITVDKHRQIVYTYKELKKRLRQLGSEFGVSFANVSLIERVAKSFDISRSMMYKIIKEEGLINAKRSNSNDT